jgi:hypothetical protein
MVGTRRGIHGLQGHPSANSCHAGRAPGWRRHDRTHLEISIDIPAVDSIVEDPALEDSAVYAVVPPSQLDLSTPSAALLTFVDRLAAGDTRNATLILDPAIIRAAEVGELAEVAAGLVAPRYFEAVQADLDDLDWNTQLTTA